MTSARAGVVVGALALVVAIRVVRHRRASSGQVSSGQVSSGQVSSRQASADSASPAPVRRVVGRWGRRRERARPALALVAGREIRERTRSRFFVIGTVVLVLGVAAGVVVPVLQRGHRGVDRVGVVGHLSTPIVRSIEALGPVLGTSVVVVPEPGIAAATAGVSDGNLTLLVVDGRQVVVRRPFAPGNTSTAALLSEEVARVVALQSGLEKAGLSPPEAARLAHPAPLPVRALQSQMIGSTGRTVGLYGVVLTFILLTQYGMWVLMGVVEEKASRIAEVLLSAIRPRQLLGGKVLGIGTVGLGQAAVVVGVALGLAGALHSTLLQGAALTSVVMALLWVVLGYALYCWVYAAAGSLAERQEHVQALAFPVQLPILVGYLVSLTALASGNASLLLRVIAFVPPTAPFAMPVLVSLGAASWWEVVVSAALTAATTVVVARVATRVYTRAILRTGQRVRLRSVLGSRAT